MSLEGQPGAAPGGYAAGLDADLYGFAERLTSTEQSVLEELHAVLQAEVRPRLAEAWDSARLPEALTAPLTRLRLMDPPALARAGEPLREIMRGFISFEIARCDLSVATWFNAQASLFRTLCRIGGDPETAAELDQRIRSYELTGVFALTEPGHGSDVARGLSTTAARSPDGTGWILDGAKRWIGGADRADVLATFARDAEGGRIRCFLVPREAPGVDVRVIRHKASLRIMQNAEIRYERVEVPDDARLPGIDGFADVSRCLRRMRSDVAWMAVGAMAGAYEAALRQVGGREQFGRPLAGFQLIQEKIARMLGQLTGSLALVVRLTEQQQDGIYREETSALAKMQTALALRDVVALAREVCGGDGITLESDVARFHADAEAVYSYEGTHEINALLVGRAVTGHSAFV
ncbi:acyl-CoA dehydrogenase family protein [Nesterenkonia sp. CL21]|uniref:acyl-CoA dehydrogenase family protein n=1 Tax=Nesterenkonia sp. CL21 TaxID=3064894 RepID=UPI002878AA67|nr:acyl-CoA dehydrogenase family protein [Nesterenkonia sp. CL21]MDS2173497.1 acyl-CoA dehydrogenase family protein [Nesterenkonia sp. CL21]